MPQSDRILTTRPGWKSVVAAACLVITAGWLAPASAKVLDFGAALQQLDEGKTVERVSAGGGTMYVRARNDDGGPDEAIVFDSADPTDDNEALGTPNADFGGPGKGDGGEAGEPGENRVALGHILVVAADDDDKNGDGLVDVPKECHHGVLWLAFSHTGRLSFTLIDAEEHADAPRVLMYHDGDFVDEAEGESLGENSAQRFDLSRYGDIDAVKIILDGGAGIGAIELEVPTVDTAPSTWSQVKGLFR